MTNVSETNSNSMDERRWVMIRDRIPDAGSEVEPFFYGVATTGVVCRPGCPSRTPRREKIRLFDSVQDALRFGFRACLRCRPADTGFARQTADRMEELVSTIAAQVAAGQKVSLKKLARAIGLSPFHLQRTFRASVGVTPAQYSRRLRAQRLDQQLTSAANAASATTAIFAAGYQSVSRAYGGVDRSGVTPGSRRQGGRGEVIGYCTADCPLGRVLVAATTQGVCSIAFADDDETLLQDLRERFAAAELHEDPAALGAELRAVLAGFAEPTVALTLSLHIRATAFQDRVWRALQAIPRGETRTYGQVATGIGQPTAVRAVARACASNPVALAIPCHRVVGSGGALSGYRWGLERKRRLLEIERNVGTIKPGTSLG